MVSAKLQGGLGNYLFQIAAAHCLAKQNNDEAVFDMALTWKGHQDITTYQSNILRKIKFAKPDLTCQYDSPGFEYHELPYAPGVLLNGYFQSYKYLDENLIRDLFSIDDESQQYIANKYGTLFKNSVSIHVRRGDYLTRSDRHPVQELEYYTRAIENFDPESIFYIFSDDIDWCKQVFKGSKFRFMEDNPDYIDMWLMSQCTHNIIANSSFSWWAAWLNRNVDKVVIAPKNWFGPKKPLNTKDLLPKTWKVI